MKCQLCGSELDTGFNCAKCGYKKNEAKPPEPTTAEKLWWLVENGASIYKTTAPADTSGYIMWYGKETFWGSSDNIRCKTLSEAIETAYKWVKEQEC